MSVPISSSTSALAANADGLRPQVQSRRVSVQLGPLGIRYSTDEVLWSAAAATSTTASGAVNPSGLEPDSASNESQAASSPQAQAQAAQAGAQANRAERSFGQELREARQRQARHAGENAQYLQTYGPDGLVGGSLGTSSASSSASAAEASSEQESAQDTGDDAQTSADAQSFSASAQFVRRAISAYLACARGFQSARPMLSATA